MTKLQMDNEKKEEEHSSLVFVYYVTGHGFGHATRVVEVVRHLIKAGHEVHVVTGAPGFIFKREIPSSKLHVRKVLLDCGAVQTDALTVDRIASIELYAKTAVFPRASLLDTEVEWLRSIQANLVVSDIVPIACSAAAQAGIPSVCVSNFSWDFIYSEYMAVAGVKFRSVVWQIAEDYSKALFLIRLPGYCPMPAFKDVIDVPLVVRNVRKSRQQVREELGIAEDETILLFNFGGQDAKWALKEEYLPAGWKCLVCGAPAEQQLGSNFVRMDRDVYTPDLIAASDCMLGKIGYGTVSEALAYKVPLVFVRRDYFNEEPFLRKMLECYRGGVEMTRRDFFSGRWGPFLQRAVAMKPCYDGEVNGGKVAAKILQDAAVGKVHKTQKQSGARRLQDAIIFGFQMQRHPGRDIEVPDWYSTQESQLGLSALLHTDIPSVFLDKETTNALKLGVPQFEILHGDLGGLPDTARFLKTLGRIDEDGDVVASDHAEKPQEQERLAAAGLFRWEEEVFVSRAPGRLDVMGGISDYSGGLVLQMPIREACHVAVQRQPPGKQRLWKHMIARHPVEGRFKPAVRIVSFGSELSNRAPSFDMDIEDFYDSEGNPIGYDAARKYFEQDPSRKWAAYVAGTLLVLIREHGVKFQDGISILVSSAVPEGKGVSSSAALEVATMSALAAAHGLDITPKELAILCQKVENLVVGAPCGIMDQMASACGEAYKLLAMVCQPADVKEHINIPTNLRFWGLDSGIRHSVGGADYGSVRVGAFMGRRIVQSEAQKLLTELSQQLPDSSTVDDQLDETLQEVHEANLSLVDKEANLDYLCNIRPHRFEAQYTQMIPSDMSGKTFTERFGDHKDPVTRIDLNRTYNIRAPTAHPVYENFRVKTFASLLTVATTDEQLGALGELMYQSHSGYSSCGLGSKGTDRLVSLTRYMQCNKRVSSFEKGPLFGAKISGGGCGGTVCVVGRHTQEAEKQIGQIQELYRASTGHLPYLFEGSSPGAAQFGYLRILRRK
ncbi:unnamed protein product [Calypogeia fissa]